MVSRPSNYIASKRRLLASKRGRQLKREFASFLHGTSNESVIHMVVNALACIRGNNFVFHYGEVALVLAVTEEPVFVGQ